MGIANSLRGRRELKNLKLNSKPNPQQSKKHKILSSF